MYPVLPIESMVGSIQFMCYFFTGLVAALSMMLTRR